tara:strand:+ start:673 stop:1176 length:504 start_codon:yes stop_codon:yes gene_type:complete
MKRLASEVIRNLEMRIARLERQAKGLNLTSARFVKVLEDNGFKSSMLGKFKNGIKPPKKAFKTTQRVTRIVAKVMSRDLLEKKAIIIKGVSVIRANENEASRKFPPFDAIVTDEGVFIGDLGSFESMLAESFGYEIKELIGDADPRSYSRALKVRVEFGNKLVIRLS